MMPILSNHRVLTPLKLSVSILAATALWPCKIHAIQINSKTHLFNPATNEYDEFYVPPQLLKPSDNFMAMIWGQPGPNPPQSYFGPGGVSGVVVAPDWVLTSKHGGGVQGTDVWVAGNHYVVDEAFVHPTTDLRLLRIVDFTTGNSPTLPYVSIDPNLLPSVGHPVTLGGFSDQKERNPITGDPTGNTLHDPGLLTWGRNYLTRSDIAVSLDISQAEDIRFKGVGADKDSGGGWFVRDGWDWRLTGNFTTGATGPSTIFPAYYEWIDETVGGLPQAVSSARPAATVIWRGGTASWHNAANWEDATTHQDRLPQYDDARMDAVEIVSTGNGPTITSSATAHDIFLGTVSTNYSQMTIQANGALVANTIFAGAEAGEKGVVSQTGGSVNAEVEYIGYQGAIGGYFHQGGANNTLLLSVGKENSATDLAAYHMQGSISPSGRPVLSAKAVEIGGAVGANGLLLIEAGNGTLAEVEIALQAVVGARGHGEVVQEVGSFNAGHLFLGKYSTGVGEYSLDGGSLLTNRSTVGADGDGTFTQTGGTHSTEILSIGSSSNYLISGGALEADLVEVDGTLTMSGGQLATNRVNGAINFANSTATIRGEGFVDLRNTSFLNSSNANLVVEEETLVLLASANPFNTTQIGSLTPHTVGSTLNIDADGFRVRTGDFLGTTLLPDHVEFTNEGFANVLGDGHLGFLQGARVYSSSAAPITAWLSSGVGSMDFAAYGSHLGLEVDAGATLRADGKFDFGNASVFHNAGRLEIGGGLGAASVADLEIKAGSALTTSTQFELANTADLVINIDRDVTQVVSDAINVEKALTSLSGNLSLVELSGFQAAPKEQFTILTTDLFRLEGAFSSITVDDGDPATNAIFTNTSGGLAAYAVIYTDPNTDFRSSVDVRVSLPADFDLDDDVDAADSARLFSNWGMTGATWIDGDANGDGVVNGDDFIIHQANVFRSWPSFSAVPEPNVLLLTTVAFLPLVASKKKQRRRKM